LLGAVSYTLEFAIALDLVGFDNTEENRAGICSKSSLVRQATFSNKWKRSYRANKTTYINPQ